MADGTSSRRGISTSSLRVGKRGNAAAGSIWRAIAASSSRCSAARPPRGRSLRTRSRSGRSRRLDTCRPALPRPGRWPTTMNFSAGCASLVSVVTQASLAAKNATSTVPIVIVSVADPVGAGLVASLARPGANVTGTSAMTSEVIGKSLALLKQTVPTVSPVVVLWNPNNEVYQGQILRETEMAAGKLGVELQTFGVRTPDEFDRTFAAITSARAASLLVLPDPLFSAYTARIADLADKSRLPAMYGLREDVAAGGLLAYGPKYADLYRRAAYFVDKILKGAKPADLPVEQPTKFEFIINLKTAGTLGLAIPPGVLAIADEVIE